MLTNYAEKLISRLDAKPARLSGRWRAKNHLNFQVEIVTNSDNGIGQLIAIFPDGKAKECSKNWFERRFKLCK